MITDFDSDDKDVDIYAYCHDISLTGLFIRTESPLPVGTTIRLRFRFPYDLSEFAAEAMVKWTRHTEDQRGPSGMGMAFVNLDEKLGQDLADHLNYYRNSKKVKP